jgi:two-component system, chemotaxis family, sensor kinase Cph1
MSHRNLVNEQTIDLAEYDKEPIHAPGTIQPHGVLLVLQGSQFKIQQVSGNTFDLLGLQPEELLKKSLKDLLLDPEQIKTIKQCLLQDFGSINPLKLAIKNPGKTVYFDGIVHRSGKVIILELEPVSTKGKNNFSNFYHLVQPIIVRMQKAKSPHELCQAITTEIRRLTGFDRIIIYRFGDDGSGTVIAEAKTKKITPLMGLHFPDLDIPNQAKKLFSQSFLRLIPDAQAQPVPLIPMLNPTTKQPLDMSFCTLRSVSPCHIDYLKNMGVRAAMSISLIHQQRLWGLIACHHHQSPKHVSYETRTMCEFLGQTMALELSNKEEHEDLEYKLKLRSIQASLMDTITRADNFVDGLVANSANLLDIVGAQGVALYLDERLICAGETPEEEDIYELIQWVHTQTDNHIFYTDSLSKLYPSAEKFQSVASGLLALSIAPNRQTSILWFRPEVIQTVNWGGDPTTQVDVEDSGSLRLSPRKSFELWQETVQQTALPWLSCEIEAALELRSSIVGIVLQKADELARVNLELAQSNQELDAFAYIASHDLKEPLRGIHNYSSLLIEDYAQLLDEEGVAKLQTLARLTQRMEDLIESLLHFSRLGRVELSMHPTDLNEVLKNALDILRINRTSEAIEIRIPRPLPVVLCDPTQINELFTNLISNAIKYNNKEQKWVEIGYLDADSVRLTKAPAHYPIFYVRDNGIGILEKHLGTIFQIFKRLHAPTKYGNGTGAGLTIAKKIVERHHGKIWVESIVDLGSTFYFTLKDEEENHAR